MGMALIAILVSVAGVLWEAFALKQLWGWFLVPLAAPAINIWQAIGISTLVGLLTHQPPADLDDDDRISRYVRWQIVAPAVALVVGFICK